MRAGTVGSMAEFMLAIDDLLLAEGGYVDDPADPGGETNFGISKRSYPEEDIANMTRLRAAGIYRRDFWDPLGCDEIANQRIAAAVFDAAVNLGAKQAVKLLQRAAGCAVDGFLGPRTIKALNDAQDPEKVLAIFTLNRIAHYVGLAIKRKANQKFLAGWIIRSLNVAKVTS